MDSHAGGKYLRNDTRITNYKAWNTLQVIHNEECKSDKTGVHGNEANSSFESNIPAQNVDQGWHMQEQLSIYIVYLERLLVMLIDKYGI